MRHIALCFLFACGSEETTDIAGYDTAPTTAAVTDSVMERLRAQTTDITPADPGPLAIADDAEITPDIAWDIQQFNPKRMICVAWAKSNALVGYADFDAVRALLPDDVEPIVQDFKLGRKGVPVLISMAEFLGLAGCTCPPRFNEFTIAVPVMPSDRSASEVGTSEGTVYAAFLYASTDHLKRQETMVHKFSIDTQFSGIPSDPGDEGHLGLYERHGKTVGLYAKNQDGDVIFTAKRHVTRIPEPKVAQAAIDYVFYGTSGAFSFSGNKKFDLFGLNGQNLTATYYRVQDRDHHVAFSLAGTPPLSAAYLPLADSWHADKRSAPGRILDGIDFKPVVWTSELYTQGMAWVPPPR